MKFALTMLAFSCGGDKPTNTPNEPTFIEVSGILLTETTDEDASGAISQLNNDERIDFVNTERSVQVSGSTLDRNADPYAYSEWVEVSVRPGTIQSVQNGTETVDEFGKTHWYVKAEEGLVETTVRFTSAFGDTHVWLSAAGNPEEFGSGGSYATGVTEGIPIHQPTITQLQDVSTLTEEDPFTTSPLFGEFVTVRTEDRKVVVTALTTKGFWVSDLDDAPGNYSGLFVYTFNKPEEVEVGDRIGLLAGGVQEYVGATQLSFPLYEAIEGEKLSPPPSSVIPADQLCDGRDPNNSLLEEYESSLITIESGVIPEGFRETEPGTDPDPDYNQFLEYGQWPIETEDGCRFYVISNATVPGFNPVDYAGQDVGPVTGVLSYVRAGGHKWMLLARDGDDLPIAPVGDASEDEAPAGPPWPLHPRTPQATSLCDHTHGGHTHGPHTKD